MTGKLFGEPYQMFYLWKRKKTGAVINASVLPVA